MLPPPGRYALTCTLSAKGKNQMTNIWMVVTEHGAFAEIIINKPADDRETLLMSLDPRLLEKNDPGSGLDCQYLYQGKIDIS
jgi:hypothetical protein